MKAGEKRLKTLETREAEVEKRLKTVAEKEEAVATKEASLKV